MPPSLPPVVYEVASEQDIPSAEAFNPVGEQTWGDEYFSLLKPGSVLVIARSEGMVVGTEGYISYPMMVDGRLMMTHRSERTLVSPTMRGRGVFNALIESCSVVVREQSSAFCWGSTTALKPFQNSGFHAYTGHRAYLMIPLFPSRLFSVAFWRRAVLEAGVRETLRRLWQRDLPAVKEALGVAAAAMSPRAAMRLRRLRLGVLTHEPAPRASDDIDKLHQQVTATDSAVSIQHSPELFAWVRRRVGHEILVVCSYDAAELRAYLCVLVNPQSNVAELVDFCAASPADLLAAIAALRERLRGTGASSLFVAVNTHNRQHAEVLAALKPYAPVHIRNIGRFVVRPESLDDPSLYDDLRRWYLTDLWLLM